MKFVNTTITALAFAIAGVSYTASADQQTVDAVEHASQTNDIQLLMDLAQNTQGFDQALAYYRLAISHNISGDAQSANESLEQSQNILQSLEGAESEVNTLLAQVYGYKISINPFKGAVYGPKAATTIEKAIKRDELNPRAYLVNGISAYNTPALFGGSNEQALKHFNKAISLYQDDNNLGYQWGKSEAYVWRGLTYIALNEQDNAVADFKEALRQNPDYAWAQMLLNANK